MTKAELHTALSLMTYEERGHYILAISINRNSLRLFNDCINAPFDKHNIRQLIAGVFHWKTSQQSRDYWVVIYVRYSVAFDLPY